MEQGVELVLQGRRITASEIEIVKKLIGENPSWNRTRLSKELCALWDWRRASGQLEDITCRSLLRKLEYLGYIQLPVGKRKNDSVDCVMRLHQRRKEKRIIKTFSKNDYLVSWEKDTRSQKSVWMTQEQWDQLPKEMIIYHVKVVIDIPWFRTKKLTLATTLLDAKKYLTDALADPYRRRWIAELFLIDIKITMRMEALRCKTPEMIHKELSIFIIAYNLIHSLIWEAVINSGVGTHIE
jgi:hypothetical protein